jgi:hypothetical protein
VLDHGRGRPSRDANKMSAGRQPNVKRGARLGAGGALSTEANSLADSLPPPGRKLDGCLFAPARLVASRGALATACPRWGAVRSRPMASDR